MPSRLGYVPRDLFNKLLYGRVGPIAEEPIWIDPREVKLALVTPTEIGLASENPSYAPMFAARRRAAALVGQVVEDEIDERLLVPLERLRKVQACIRRWRHGLSWEESGAIDHLMFKIGVLGPMSGCRSREDVLRRYAHLDEVFRRVQSAGRIESRACLRGPFTREFDGIQIHLGRDGKLVFGMAGTHRLAMALVIGLRRIPASLGYVHRTALARIPELRAGGSDQRRTWTRSAPPSRPPLPR